MKQVIKIPSSRPKARLTTERNLIDHKDTEFLLEKAQLPFIKNSVRSSSLIEQSDFNFASIDSNKKNS